MPWVLCALCSVPGPSSHFSLMSSQCLWVFGPFTLYSKVTASNAEGMSVSNLVMITLSHQLCIQCGQSWGCTISLPKDLSQSQMVFMLHSIYLPTIHMFQSSPQGLRMRLSLETGSSEMSVKSNKVTEGSPSGWPLRMGVLRRKGD